MAEKFQKGKFDFNDLLSQMQQMKKMGGMGAMMKLLPGLGNMAAQLENAGVDESLYETPGSDYLSMTATERAKPELLNAKRRIRIANGSGTSVQDVNKITKQLEQMQKMMRQVKKMGAGKMMGMMNKMTGGKMDDFRCSRNRWTLTRSAKTWPRLKANWAQILSHPAARRRMPTRSATELPPRRKEEVVFVF
jgi:signal recognition particle GTPase